ncbi:unnamed protein product [Didymodactylos carnosus]|uniref:Uncharacterized protein n=1 Tax=Didymodactylos carnosus TaxID=1234261 RepID=A0A814M3S4_9BILA|nr:unnamed protein product [Didymodactylos carnosus]CAF1071433.1 unnamed protein product [Didymodactylos carnosus]CAF3789911.1 unnamed protein product [Didymodactylos carnosus]CAF3838508.1 unnamed protein product [Didymodactylos carnosus]
MKDHSTNDTDSDEDDDSNDNSSTINDEDDDEHNSFNSDTEDDHDSITTNTTDFPTFDLALDLTTSEISEEEILNTEENGMIL